MKNIIIMGGTGFIGKNLVIHFSKNKKYKVIATYFKSPKYKCSNVRWIKADLRNPKIVNKILKNIDIVIQAAATTSGSNDIINNPYLHITDNAVMNSLILRSCFENKIKHFIFFSCTTMYPSSKKPLKEYQFTYDGILKNYYGVAHTKLYIENMCKFFSSLNITKHTVIRHSNIYGPFDKFDLKKSHFFGASMTKVLTSQKNITLWGKGNEKRDLLYIDDLINFINLAINSQKNSYKLYNCSYGKSYSVKEVIKKIIKASGKKLDIRNDLTRPNLNINILVDSSKAINELGWTPKITLEQGIVKTIDWWKKNIKC